MKKLLSFLLIVLPVYLVFSLYFLDKDYFLCPIKYQRDIVVRSDLRGNGLFAAERSGRRLHKGLDLFAVIDTQILASRSGRVIAATQNNGMGKYVILQHANNLTTLYGHLSKIYVAKNEFVRQGEVIASVGKTGNANSPDIQPHLHFEVRKDGIPQDPLEYLQ
ncbi:MAG: M23 family metallopeptidase [Candidatus Omnitrophica bacterium]|nr:M23 family metallopeptidase [Candidatus Omnitrophota bacterium]